MSWKTFIGMFAEAGVIREYAEKMVKFPMLSPITSVKHQISQPIGPRELLLSVKKGMIHSYASAGLKKPFVNEFPNLDICNNSA
ncbi:hypothetical protein QM042_02450 [Escherichia coli]|uniref:hypothetical protein n=1 Tax=Escherichia coli TaxID=562 RepID=UPI003986FF4F